MKKFKVWINNVSTETFEAEYAVVGHSGSLEFYVDGHLVNSSAAGRWLSVYLAEEE